MGKHTSGPWEVRNTKSGVLLGGGATCRLDHFVGSDKLVSPREYRSRIENIKKIKSASKPESERLWAKYLESRILLIAGINCGNAFLDLAAVRGIAIEILGDISISQCEGVWAVSGDEFSVTGSCLDEALAEALMLTPKIDWDKMSEKCPRCDSLDCIAEQTRNNEALRVRAEKAEAEAFNARRNASIADEQARNDRAELAKRGKVLEQAVKIGSIKLSSLEPGIVCAYDEDFEIHPFESAPELAEWLKNREEKS